MKKTQKNKAITLIALVVTMVILLILAGISINMLFGENGIINKAKMGKTKFLGEDAREVVEQKVAALRQDSAQKGVNTTLYDFWFMYNGDLNSDYYTDDMAIYLFTDSTAAKFKPTATKTAQYSKDVEYTKSVVIYKDYVTAVNKNMVVSRNAAPVDEIFLTDEEINTFEDSITNSNGEAIPTDINNALNEAKVIETGIVSNAGKISDTEYVLADTVLNFVEIKEVGEGRDYTSIKAALDYFLAKGEKENVAIILSPGTYDTANIHVGSSNNIDPRYNGMKVSVIGDSPGNVKLTGGEMMMCENGSQYAMEVNFYRILFIDSVYGHGFHLTGDYMPNSYHNCVFLSTTGGWNGVINNTECHTYNCLFTKQGNGYASSNPISGTATNCASTSTFIEPNNGTKTTCLTNVTIDSHYHITSQGWQNAGTGTNPNGTKAHIGVYGGQFAWAEYED